MPEYFLGETHLKQKPMRNPILECISWIWVINVLHEKSTAFYVKPIHLLNNYHSILPAFLQKYFKKIIKLNSDENPKPKRCTSNTSANCCHFLSYNLEFVWSCCSRVKTLLLSWRYLSLGSESIQKLAGIYSILVLNMVLLSLRRLDFLMWN